MQRKSSQSGFSLIEMVIAMTILLVIIAVIFTNIGKMSARATREDMTVDVTQSARESLDQISRDLHQAGYPNRRTINLNAAINGNLQALGITTLTATRVDFQGDLESDGTVEIVSYRLQPTDGACPCALQRAVTIKGSGAAPVYYDILTNVINSNGAFPISGYGPKGSNDTVYASLKSSPVFTGINASGGPAATLSSIRAVRIDLNMFASAHHLEDGMRPLISTTATARLHNITY